MTDRPIILIHGYSDTAKGFETWRKIINDLGRPAASIYVGSYVSLSNEVTIKDVAEGFDRALVREAGVPPDGEFDAIVHSTGMLVLRCWLNSYAEGEQRRARLKHLIALAPATNGSPLAHQGRSWLGSIFKGSKKLGPDFMEAGDEILYGLELGSRFTWDLAYDDLINDNARFKPGPETPFVFTFCGNRNYGFAKSLVTESKGTDGTVRWAGCALNSRKITIDLMVAPGSDREPTIKASAWANQEHPLLLVDGVNHGTIMSDPPALLQDLVKKALDVETEAGFSEWVNDALEQTKQARANVARWQQFVIRVMDERGDPVNDWNMQLFGRSNAKQALQLFALDVHVYKRDPSLRCFHVNLDDLKPERLSQLHLRLLASSGSQLVAYHGAGSERITPDGTAMNPEGKWDAQLNLSEVVGDNKNFTLFYPFTTTFIEIRLNREPMPMVGKNNVYWFAKQE
jgi:hypothetical protein